MVTIENELYTIHWKGISDEIKIDVGTYIGKSDTGILRFVRENGTDLLLHESMIIKTSGGGHWWE